MERDGRPHVGGEAQLGTVGRRLRRLRRMRGATLREVAASAGVSPSFLSMLERGQADISVSRLTRLAAFFDLRTSDLLIDQDEPQRPQLLQPDDALLIDRGPGVTYRAFPERLFGIQVVHCAFEPHGGFRDALAHEGVDWVWVTKGELVLLYADEEYPVAAGQAVSYEGKVPHAFANQADAPAELLGFVAPSYW